jgi:hypothetical protein
MVAVFDTNIVIDALNGQPEADAEYGRYERVLIGRIITWMEMLVGAQDDGTQDDGTQVRDFSSTQFESHFTV